MPTGWRLFMCIAHVNCTQRYTEMKGNTEGNHKAPTDRFLRSNLDLLLNICSWDMSSFCPIGCWRSLFLLLVAGSPRHLVLLHVTRWNNGFLQTFALYWYNSCIHFINRQLWLLVQILTYCQTIGFRKKRKTRTENASPAILLSFNATVFGHTLCLLLKKLRQQADSTGS